MTTQRIVDDITWDSWATKVASPAHPADYVDAAVERMMRELDPYVSIVKNVRSQFKPYNTVCLIDFMTEDDRISYQKAYEEWIELREKITGGGYVPSSAFVEERKAKQKFHQRSELLRAPSIAKSMFQAVSKRGLAAACCFNYKQSISKAIWELTSKYGVDRNQISIIWGGDSKYNAMTDQKIPDAEIAQVLMDYALQKPVDKKKLKQIQIQLEATIMGFDDLPKDLHLGVQSKKERQENIDRFQQGKALYVFYTYKSGGIGLSLHHTDEWTKQKVRRKPSGYAYEEDIELIPTRQRITYLAPTYSALDLVQGLGRVPRITSLSDTMQAIVFFAGTVEVDIARKYSMKLRCLKKVVRQREHWEDTIWDQGRASDYTKDNLSSDIPLLDSLTKDKVEETSEEDMEILMGDYQDDDEEREDEED